MFICFFAAQLQATLAEVSIEGLVSTSGGVMTAQDAGTSGMSGSAVDAQLNDLGKAQIKEIYNETDRPALHSGRGKDAMTSSPAHPAMSFGRFPTKSVSSIMK